MVILTLSLLLESIFLHHSIIKFAKIICNTEKFSNFVLGNY